MQILIPNVSCIVTSEEEFTAAKNEGYLNIYLLTINGIFFHRNISPTRHVRVKVDSIPELKVVKDAAVFTAEEEISFLPGGKIPEEMLDKIVQFFRKVIEIKKNSLEAMAHILWRKDTGYRIAVPNQKIGAASVTYENNHIEPGDSVILDIHSHNTMNAFFSGTDNRDDEHGVYYSGVVGKLTDPVPQMVFRFNMGKIKRPVKVEDIFDINNVIPQIEDEWLQKVSIETPFASHAGMMMSEAGLWNKFGTTKKEPEKDHRTDMLQKQLALLNENPMGSAVRFDFRTTKNKPEEKKVSVEDQAPAKQKTEVDFNSLQELEDIEQVFGEKKAASFDICMTSLEDLEGDDDLLQKILSTAYERMSPVGQEKIHTNGL